MQLNYMDYNTADRNGTWFTKSLGKFVQSTFTHMFKTCTYQHSLYYCRQKQYFKLNAAKHMFLYHCSQCLVTKLCSEEA